MEKWKFLPPPGFELQTLGVARSSRYTDCAISDRLIYFFPHSLLIIIIKNDDSCVLANYIVYSWKIHTLKHFLSNDKLVYISVTSSKVQKQYNLFKLIALGL
jgi:hypothetical protein